MCGADEDMCDNISQDCPTGLDNDSDDEDDLSI